MVCKRTDRARCLRSGTAEFAPMIANVPKTRPAGHAACRIVSILVFSRVYTAAQIGLITASTMPIG